MNAPAYPRTEQALEALEEAICRNCGDLNAAARELNYPARYVHMWGLQDPSVAERIRQAQMIGWAGLESAAYERAVLGVERPVFYKGEQIGTTTDYSDGLLSQMLKARVPGYSEATNHQHVHMVNVNLMPRASSYEEWTAQRTKELEGPSEQVEEAQYTEISPETASVLRDVL